MNQMVERQVSKDKSKEENNDIRDINHLLAYYLMLSRENAHLTQKELAKKTGIYQADISKLERGLGNPSLSTLKRLADGLDMELEIRFVEKKRVL